MLAIAPLRAASIQSAIWTPGSSTLNVYFALPGSDASSATDFNFMYRVATIPYIPTIITARSFNSITFSLDAIVTMQLSSFQVAIQVGNYEGFSPLSKFVTTRTIASPPSAPRLIEIMPVVGMFGNFSFLFSPPLSNGGSAITGYVLTSATTLLPAPKLLCPSCLDSYIATVVDVAANSSYTFTFAARNAQGIGNSLNFTLPGILLHFILIFK
jgi:hypothetical protein